MLTNLGPCCERCLAGQRASPLRHRLPYLSLNLILPYLTLPYRPERLRCSGIPAVNDMHMYTHMYPHAQQARYASPLGHPCPHPRRPRWQGARLQRARRRRPGANCPMGRGGHVCVGGGIGGWRSGSRRACMFAWRRHRSPGSF